jgi:hypothetical protein
VHKNDTRDNNNNNNNSYNINNNNNNEDPIRMMCEKEMFFPG